MARADKIRGGPIAAGNFFARTFVGLLGLGAVAWGGTLLPLFWQQAPLNRVSAEVLQGHTFRAQSLLDLAQQAASAGHSAFCNPATLHDAIIVRLVALEEAIATSDQTIIHSAYDPLYDATRAALTCSPTDSFAWLTLFWLEVGKHGYAADDARYMRLSYALGPNEGWIAHWRNQLAFAVFERLPTDLADEALDEFIKLVDTGPIYRQVYDQAAAIFTNAAPAVQSRIVEHLATADSVPRQVFARTLYDKGLDVTIPGIDFTPARPWR